MQLTILSRVAHCHRGWLFLITLNVSTIKAVVQQLLMKVICSFCSLAGKNIMIVGHGANSMTMEEARAKLCAEAKYVSCLIFCFLNYSGLFHGKKQG